MDAPNDSMPVRMLSFRIPVDLIEDIDKYSYVARETKQDVIIKAFRTFFELPENLEVVKEYEKIKK